MPDKSTSNKWEKLVCTVPFHIPIHLLANRFAGKNERRYFTGVAGVKGEEGELFGLANLFKLNTSNVMTNGISKKRKESN